VIDTAAVWIQLRNWTRGGGIAQQAPLLPEEFAVWSQWDEHLKDDDEYLDTEMAAF
jgi:hypothetical protein